jgi:hypothetical protein
MPRFIYAVHTSLPSRVIGTELRMSKLRTSNNYTTNSTNIVRLPRRRVDTVLGLVNVIAMDAAHKGSVESGFHHSFWQTYKLAP